MMTQKNEMKISVVIPILNEATYIGRLLHQLKDCKQLELIVVDGGSVDDSISIAEQYNTLLMKSEKGRSIQMNKGAAVANAPYLIFLHADVQLPEGFCNALEFMVDCDIQLANFRLDFDLDHWFLRTNSYFTRFSATIFQFGDQGLLIRKSLFQQIGGYDEKLLLAEGQDIIRRAKKVTKLKKMKLRLKVSARKYRTYGVFYLQFAYYFIYLLYRMKVRPDRLATIYKWLLQKNCLNKMN